MSLVLMHPFTTPTTTVVVRHVELNNQELYNMKVDTHVSMDGTLRSRVKTETENTYRMVVSNMTPNKAHQVRDFFVTAKHDDIKIRDWNNLEYKVKFAEEPIVIKSEGVGPKGKDAYSMELEFVGDRI